MTQENVEIGKRWELKEIKYLTQKKVQLKSDIFTSKELYIGLLGRLTN